jgi:hypothetical protein
MADSGYQLLVIGDAEGSRLRARLRRAKEGRGQPPAQRGLRPGGRFATANPSPALAGRIRDQRSEVRDQKSEVSGQRTPQNAPSL